MKCGSFSPLALRSELIATHKRGTIIHSETFSVKFLPSSKNKMAFIIRKKVGNSPERNLIKRRFREIIRNIPTGNTHIQCLIIAKRDTLSYPFNKLDHDTKRVFCKIFNQFDN